MTYVLVIGLYLFIVLIIAGICGGNNDKEQ
jgi:hypothetical protein